MNPVDVTEGSGPVILGIPHVGTYLRNLLSRIERLALDGHLQHFREDPTHD